MLEKHKYSPDEKAFMIEYVPGHSHKEIMEAFNEKFNSCLGQNQIKGFIANHKLNTGRSGQFKAGDVPFNKGKKGMNGWSSTQYKKGDRIYNQMPIGTEKVRGDGYIWVKIADPNKWKQKNQIVWEAEHGSIPKGYVLVFADGDRLNVCLDNLLLVSRNELAILNKNKLIKSDKALTKSGLLIAKVIVKTHELRK